MQINLQIAHNAERVKKILVQNLHIQRSRKLGRQVTELRHLKFRRFVSLSGHQRRYYAYIINVSVKLS